MSLATLALNSGRKIPALGLGTFNTKPGEAQAAVEEAISCGYRHIDGAEIYRNQEEVGNGIQTKINDGTVRRKDIFITNKLWCTYHAVKDVKPALVRTLKKMQLDYFDLYLIHWPVGFVNNGNLHPMNQNGEYIPDDSDYVDTWKAMEELQKEGLVRDIGVSNFNQYQLTRIMKECSVKPVVNQIEVHPYLVQEDLIKFCKNNDIVVTAHSPFGSPYRPWAGNEDPIVLEDHKIVEIATKIGKTPAQVLLRLAVQRGLVVIPKSVTPSRIKSNFQVFDFTLSQKDMATLLGLSITFRVCAINPCINHKYYPFKKNYFE